MFTPLPLNNERLRSINCWKTYATGPETQRLIELISGRSPPTGNPGRGANRRPRRANPPPPANPLEHYAPSPPFAKQRLFLSLDCVEAFYGGAAAGGKSTALLMAALQHAATPGYAALILRKDTQRLRLAGGLIPRAHEWLAGRGPIWRERDQTWVFATAGAPATLSFGYLRESRDKYRYGSSEYQFIAFDELTEFPEDDYLFLFSRLRRTRGVAAPLRMRSASNPGNVGHAWVKRRFISEQALREGADPADVYFQAGAAYVPARIADNPAVDAAAYRANLAHLPPLYRERLMNGDWSVREEGLIRPEWLRYYQPVPGGFELLDARGQPLGRAPENACRRLAVIDPAGASADRARERRGRPPSWSVIQVWDHPLGALGHCLLLRHVWRARVGFDGLCHALRQTQAEWRCARMLIENEKLGQAAVDLLGGELPLRLAATRGEDKVARAGPLILKLERGEVFLPRHEVGWRAELEAEWLAWTGLPGETCDQVDAAAYAARECAADEPRVIRLAPRL